MITVSFDVDAQDFRDFGAVEYLLHLQTQDKITSLEFLFENANKIEHSQHYKYETMTFVVRYNFYLSSGDETMYHLKYTK